MQAVNGFIDHRNGLSAVESWLCLLLIVKNVATKQVNTGTI